MTLTIGGQTVSLKDGTDASLRPSVTLKARNRSAGFVFVGYGIKDNRYGFDDYRGYLADPERDPIEDPFLPRTLVPSGPANLQK